MKAEVPLEDDSEQEPNFLHSASPVSTSDADEGN